MKKPRIKSRYYQPSAGEWIQPIRRGYRLACCDCGLVHLVDFRIYGGKPQFRVWRAARETAAMRRRKHEFVRGKGD